MVGPMVCTVKDKWSVVTLLVCGTMVTLTNDLCDLKCPKDFSRDPFFHSVELKRSTFTAKRSTGLYVEPLSPSNGIFGATFGDNLLVFLAILRDRKKRARHVQRMYTLN